MVNRRMLMMGSQLPIFTVSKCIQQGYFKEENGIVSVLKEFPYSISNIKDFKQTFCDDNRNGDYTINHKKFEANSNLTQEQQEEILTIYSNNELVNRNLSNFIGKVYNCPDFDLVITRGGLVSDYANAYDWDAHGNCFYDSVFNSIKLISKRGNISSMNNLFRRCKCKKIEIEGFCRPHDISGICERNDLLTSFPNTIDYSRCTNIGYAFELCYNIPELPSYYQVTDENSRISNSKNIIPLEFCEQAFNNCRRMTKIGPVLDFAKITPNATQKIPYTMFNDSLNISDVRFKNICNGDWDFRKNGWLGLPNLNKASIKYILANLLSQFDKDWGYGNFSGTSEGELIYGDMDTEDRVYGGDSITKYICIETNKILIEGDGNFSIDLVGMETPSIPNEEGSICTEYGWTKLGEIYTKTNESTKYFAISIHAPGPTKPLIVNEISIYRYDENDNKIKVNASLKHNIYFSDTIINAETAKTEFATELAAAETKGWTVFFGDTQVNNLTN